jgi:hypothetical protein
MHVELGERMMIGPCRGSTRNCLVVDSAALLFPQQPAGSNNAIPSSRKPRAAHTNSGATAGLGWPDSPELYDNLLQPFIDACHFRCPPLSLSSK